MVRCRGKGGALWRIRRCERAKRWPQVLLSAGYVAGCAFRSVLPRADVQRICVYDSWLSSVLVGRSVATIAELCFVAQWALVLREVSRDHDHAVGHRIHEFVEWREELAWMTLYFSFAVWFSIAQVHAPKAAGKAARSFRAQHRQSHPELTSPAE